MKQKILQQVIGKLAAKGKADNAPREFALGKDIITACPANDDINDYIDALDIDRFDQMGFIYIPSNGASRDELAFVDCQFHTYPEAYDFLSNIAQSLEAEYKDLPDAHAFKNLIDNFIKDAVGKMHLPHYNSQRAKEELVNHLKYIVRKSIEDYKKNGYNVNRIDKALRLYAGDIHPFG